MKISARIQSTIDLLDIILGSPEVPADKIMVSFFRERRFIGGGDRRAIAELTYSVLRNYFKLNWFHKTDSARLLVIVYLKAIEKKSLISLESLFVNEIFCPYVGEYLGNMFDFLFRLKLYGKSEENDTMRWAVDRNRVSFSIETMEFKNGTKKEELNQKPMIKNNEPIMKNNAPMMKNNEPMMKNNAPMIKNKNPMTNEKKTINENDLNNYFINNIVAGNKEFENIISKMRDYSINIFDQNALSYIKTNNKSVYDIIIEMYNSNVVQNQKLFSDINTLLFSLKANVENKNNKLEPMMKKKKLI